MSTKTRSKSLNYVVVRIDEHGVKHTLGKSANRALAMLMLARHACAGLDVDLVSSNTGRALSWVNLPCVCGHHDGPTVVQRG